MADNPSPTTPDCPFPETSPPPVSNPCSFNECLSGHYWPAILALAKCPGCSGNVIAVKKSNCPFCNEPITRTVLRSDFVPAGAGIASRCQGQPVIGESLDVEMLRTEWKRVQDSTHSFEQQQEIERLAKGNG